MQVVILSGGAGKRLWPLSNTSRSKQFLKLLKSPSGEPESMVQRVVRQIHETRLSEEITIATFESQKDHVISQFGSSIDMITEPSRKGTFPAIALASLYFKTQKRLPEDEMIAVIPCDVYTRDAYFECIKLMAEKVRKDVADIYLMGVKPKSPSPFFGYIIPKKDSTDQVEFIEKPDRFLAQKFIEGGAYWNAGVFVFKLKFIEKFLQEHHYQLDFAKFVSQYDKLPKSSFDTTVIEHTRRVGFLPYEGEWHDLGNWDALTQQIPQAVLGNVVQQNCKNTYIINELNIP
ncbi:MAG: NTP transferase domain-containing protein, partial [Muribaculaceae bacterium]|nr:NTP transferase domain-containing protein [Muribaculaceae bacterium]